MCFLAGPIGNCSVILTVSSAVIIATYLSVIALANLLGIEGELASRSIEANQSSFATRFTMWIIGFWGFWEKPLFGHGLGSFFSIYMDHFEPIRSASDFTYLALATIPHNLFIHILSEAGLFGLVVIMGPFIWLGLRLFSQNDNRWLLLGYCFRFYCTASRISLYCIGHSLLGVRCFGCGRPVRVARSTQGLHRTLF